jgi:hypothetical protein
MTDARLVTPETLAAAMAQFYSLGEGDYRNAAAAILAAIPPDPRLAALLAAWHAADEWEAAHDALTLGMDAPDDELLERYSEACVDLLAVVSQNRDALAAFEEPV